MHLCIYVYSLYQKRTNMKQNTVFKEKLKAYEIFTQNVGFLCYVYQNKHLLKVSKTKERDNEYVIL